MTDPFTRRHANQFGFEQVSPEEKTTRVHTVFQDVAHRYDLMNDLMSLGIHRLWKRRLIERLGLSSSMVLLDVAGGTGDITLGCHGWMQSRGLLTDQTRLIVCDINPSMLQKGQERALDQGIFKHIEWVQDDACTLQTMPDQSVDVYVIAFGLRNVTYVDQALAQARRVLKPSGHFYCLEFGPLESSWMQSFYQRYLLSVLPRMGACVTGHGDAYQYLGESILSFPKPEEVNDLLRQVGFRYSVSEPWTHGVVHLYRAWGIEQ